MKIKNIPSGSLFVNTYFTYDEDTEKGFIVDPGGPSEAGMNFIEESGMSPEYIILTHGHDDHIGGIASYQKAFPDIKLIAHEDEAEMLSNPEMNHSYLSTPGGIMPKPDILVKDGEEMKVGNMQLKFIHTPGHTPGGMCILVDDAVLFSGDTLFKASIGRTDFIGGSYDQLISSIRDKLFKLKDDLLVLPGHMEHTSIGFEKENNPFV